MNYTSMLITTRSIPWDVLGTQTGFKNLQAHPDVQILSPLEDKFSISIDQVHSVIANLSYKPIKEKYKILIIFPADELTLPAQQALLKTIEEPPNNTQIILVTNYPQKLLPTILSRCISQGLEVRGQGLGEDSTETQMLYTALLSQQTSIADRIKLAETHGKNKETALATLENLLLFMRKEIQTEPITQDTLSHAKKIITSIKMLNSNVNTKLVVEDTFFSFLR